MSKRKVSSLARRLLARANSVIPQWYPAARKSGEYWLVGSVNGEAGSSLKINSKTGWWRDFATSDGGSDLVSLYAAKEKLSYREAADALSSTEGFTRTHSDIAQNKAITPVPADIPLPPLSKETPHPFKSGYHLSQSWRYLNQDGELVGYVVRFDPSGERGKKQILPLSYFNSGGWQWKGLGSPYPIYGAEFLASRGDAQVLLVEGEKAADAARLLFPQLVVVTWHGGVGRILKSDWSILKGRDVLYWPDADEPGRKSIDQITDCLARVGVSRLRIVTPPTSLPSGWDLADDKPDTIDLSGLLANAADANLSSSNAFLALDEEELVSRLVWVSQTMQFFDPLTGRRFDEAQLNSLFLHRGPRLAKRLLGNPRISKAFAYTYRPGFGERVLDDGKGGHLLNLWVKPDIDCVEGDASPFVKHLRYLSTSDFEFEHLANMLAFMVQRPGEKLKSGIVLIGKQGTGKSFVGVSLGKILGAENTAFVTSTEIKSDFNDWLEAKQLVVVEEVMTLGRREVMNRLKPLITETTIRINTKHQRAYDLEQAANFIFLSNYEDALKLEAGDRRYFVVLSDNDPMGPDYYQHLWKWMHQNVGVIAHWLANRDLSDFDANARPPETEGKDRMIEAARDENEAFIAEQLAGREYPFKSDLIEISVLRENLAAMHGGQRVTQPQLRRILRNLGVDRLGQIAGIIDGKEMRKSLWALRDGATYRAMSQQSVIELYMRGLRTLQ